MFQYEILALWLRENPNTKVWETDGKTSYWYSTEENKYFYQTIKDGRTIEINEAIGLKAWYKSAIRKTAIEQYYMIK